MMVIMMMIMLMIISFPFLLFRFTDQHLSDHIHVEDIQDEVNKESSLTIDAKVNLLSEDATDLLMTSYQDEDENIYSSVSQEIQTLESFHIIPHIPLDEKTFKLSSIILSDTHQKNNHVVIWEIVFQKDDHSYYLWIDKETHVLYRCEIKGKQKEKIDVNQALTNYQFDYLKLSQFQDSIHIMQDSSYYELVIGNQNATQSIQ